ncbi:uncharacterized protein LOC117315914 [Pecten maximus]|uniref:uncharacterized protein LOC117315914 n=1 Tax=Pecten maximus TaxID=6579 RepID=UPI0014583BAC|nr:uncharacterized protein LOC117315914 [Pecten maximus]
MSLSGYAEDGHGCQVRLSSSLQQDKKVDEENGSIINIIIGVVVATIAFGLIVVAICKLIVMKKCKGNSVHSNDTSLSVPDDPFASLNQQRPTTAPVATNFTTKKFPLLEKDYLKSYKVRPTTGTGLSRPLSSRPSSGHFSLYINSRPTSLR